MAGGYDIIIEQGATFVFDLQVNDINLTSGYTARMQGRASHAATSTVFSLTTENSGLALTHQGNHSHITATIGATATALLTAPMHGVFDIEYQQTSSGTVTRILQGSFFVTPEVSRA